MLDACKCFFQRQKEKLFQWLCKGVDISKLDLSSLQKNEHFIPIRYEVLLDKILERSNLSEQEKSDLRYLGLMFQEHYHYDYHQDYLKLKSAFAPFNPDQETRYEPEYSEDEKQAFRKELIEGIRKFLEVSNYCLMAESEFADCMKLQPFGSLSVKIDTGKFDSFDVYCRGLQHVDVTDTYLYIFKHVRPTIQICRVFVLAQYKEAFGSKIIVKQFRDVQVENLKIVAPEVKLLLPIFDQIKIGGTFTFSLGWSLIKMFSTLVINLALFVTLLSMTIIAGAKGLFGFLNSRTRCMQVFSSNLYHKSLSNNVAAVSLLVDQAETQEVKEALLAYYMLYLHRDTPPSMEQLDKMVENELEQTFGFYIDFEVDDALRKLKDKNLLEIIPEENDSPETYRAVTPIPEALKRLDAIWDSIHTIE